MPRCRTHGSPWVVMTKYASAPAKFLPNFGTISRDGLQRDHQAQAWRRLAAARGLRTSLRTSARVARAPWRAARVSGFAPAQNRFSVFKPTPPALAQAIYGRARLYLLLTRVSRRHRSVGRARRTATTRTRSMHGAHRLASLPPSATGSWPCLTPSQRSVPLIQFNSDGRQCMQ